METTSYNSFFFNPGGEFDGILYPSPSNLGVYIQYPQYQLDVGGDLNFYGTLRSNGLVYMDPTAIWTSNNLIPSVDYASNTAMYASNNLGFGWSNNGSNLFSFCNIGIQVSNPEFALDVGGIGRIPSLYSSQINATNMLLNKQSPTDIPFITFNTESNLTNIGGGPTVWGEGSFMFNVTSTPIVFGTEDTLRMYISSNGNIGIGGLSNPAYPLHVDGESYMTKNIYSLSNIVCNGELIGSNLVMSRRLLQRTYVPPNLANTSNPIYVESEIIDGNGKLDWGNVKNKPKIPPNTSDDASAWGIGLGALGFAFGLGGILMGINNGVDNVVVSDILKASTSFPKEVEFGDPLTRYLAKKFRSDYALNSVQNATRNTPTMINNPLIENWG